MTDKEYLALDAVNATLLKHVATSTLAGAHYALQHFKMTQALLLGLATHCRILEPDKFDERYACAPPGLDGRTKSGKKFFDDAKASNRLVLKADVFSQVCGMEASVRKHDYASELLRVGLKEKVITWQEAGLPAKARLDIVNAKVIDLKTCCDASPRGFSKAVFSQFRYDIQGSWYLRAARANRLQVDGFIFIAVESDAPYLCAVYQLDQAAIDNADEEIDILLPRIAEARKTGVWPGYPSGVNQLYLPAWMAGGAAS